MRWYCPACNEEFTLASPADVDLAVEKQGLGPRIEEIGKEDIPMKPHHIPCDRTLLKRVIN